MFRRATSMPACTSVRIISGVSTAGPRVHTILALRTASTYRVLDRSKTGLSHRDRQDRVGDRRVLATQQPYPSPEGGDRRVADRTRQGAGVGEPPRGRVE